MNLASVVVTYNRKKQLLKNINSQLAQSVELGAIYVVDNNSTDGTEEYLREHGILEKENVYYVKLNENIGGSGGFYNGMKFAYDAGYNYICLMDDDGYFKDNNAFEILLSEAEKVHKIKKELILNSLVIGVEDVGMLAFGFPPKITTEKQARLLAEDSKLLNLINPFNATLVSRELIDKIGFPNKDFFIKGDEQDYVWRAQRAGSYIATAIDSFYYHPTLKREYLKVLGKNRIVSTEVAWKEYYRCRNYTYMFKRDKEYFKMIKQPCRQIGWAIIVGKDKKEALRLIIKGFKDGVFGKLGATVKP